MRGVSIIYLRSHHYGVYIYSYKRENKGIPLENVRVCVFRVVKTMQNAPSVDLSDTLMHLPELHIQCMCECK